MLDTATKIRELTFGEAIREALAEDTRRDPLGAAKMLEEIGISAEVVDPRTTWPLDEKTLVESARKTSRAIVIDEGYFRYDVTGELAAVIAEGAFYELDATHVQPFLRQTGGLPWA